MSTNKTPNYALHAWTPQDEFHLTEINENFAALDAGLKTEAAALQTAVADLERHAARSCVSGRAQITDYQQELTVELGFRPKLVFIQMATNTHYVIRFCTDSSQGYLSAQHNFNANIYVNQDSLLTDTGFKLPRTFLSANDNSRTTVHYVAFGDLSFS